jgi:hypothetical protein
MLIDLSNVLGCTEEEVLDWLHTERSLKGAGAFQPVSGRTRRALHFAQRIIGTNPESGIMHRAGAWDELNVEEQQKISQNFEILVDHASWGDVVKSLDMSAKDLFRDQIAACTVSTREDKVVSLRTVDVPTMPSCQWVRAPEPPSFTIDPTFGRAIADHALRKKQAREVLPRILTHDSFLAFLRLAETSSKKLIRTWLIEGLPKVAFSPFGAAPDIASELAAAVQANVRTWPAVEAGVGLEHVAFRLALAERSLWTDASARRKLHLLRA